MQNTFNETINKHRPKKNAYTHTTRTQQQQHTMCKQKIKRKINKKNEKEREREKQQKKYKALLKL